MDFNDLEHMALDILVEEKEGRAVPTEAARQFSSQFEEVMIDEYQDSNLVQEYILTSVSRQHEGRNNVFYGRGRKAEYLPVPSGQAGAVYGKSMPPTQNRTDPGRRLNCTETSAAEARFWNQ